MGVASLVSFLMNEVDSEHYLSRILETFLDELNSGMWPMSAAQYELTNLVGFMSCFTRTS